VTELSGLDGEDTQGPRDAARGTSPNESDILREYESTLDGVLKTIDEADETPEFLDRNGTAAHLYSICKESRDTVRGSATELEKAGWSKTNQQLFTQAFEDLVDAWSTYKSGLQDLEGASWEREPSPSQARLALQRPRRGYIAALDKFHVQLLVVLSYR
jgi:hypothetical protein